MKINTEIIRDLNPCADRFENFMTHYPIFEGTHEDFLSLDHISHTDKLWVILRLMSRIEVKVFAIGCDAAYAYAASVAASAASSAADYAASSAANAAANAANAAASAYSYTSATADAAYVAYVAAYAAERKRQLDAICCLINKSEE